MNRKISGWIDRWTGRQGDELTDILKEGWTDGRAYRWINGWTDRQIMPYFSLRTFNFSFRNKMTH
jgi:hypothetical protein